MKVKIKVKARKLWTMSDRDMARAAVEYAIAKLGLWACPTPITVVLRQFEDGYFGDALDRDHSFYVRIAKQGNWIKTIFHELEHIRQYVEDELEIEEGMAMWRGTKFIDPDYESCPWEAMALEAEEQLWKEFNEDMDKQLLDLNN